MAGINLSELTKYPEDKIRLLIGLTPKALAERVERPCATVARRVKSRLASGFLADTGERPVSSDPRGHALILSEAAGSHGVSILILTENL